MAPILPIALSAPLEIVGIDFLHMEGFSGGFEFILLITDHFTRYTQAYPTRNRTAKLLLISTTTFSFTLIFHLSYCVISEGNLRMLFSNTLQTCWALTICKPPLTIWK